MTRTFYMSEMATIRPGDLRICRFGVLRHSWWEGDFTTGIAIAKANPACGPFSEWPMYRTEPQAKDHKPPTTQLLARLVHGESGGRNRHLRKTS